MLGDRRVALPQPKMQLDADKHYDACAHWAPPAGYLRVTYIRWHAVLVSHCKIATPLLSTTKSVSPQNSLGTRPEAATARCTSKLLFAQQSR